jgi:DNA polymerase-1
MSDERPIIIIDGMNLFVRYFAVNETMDANGNCIGGALGFIKAINGIIETWNPSKVFVAWEKGGGSERRKRIFPEYKANRAKTKVFDELTESRSGRLHMDDDENRQYQQLLLVNLLKKTPIHQLYMREIEADDIIAFVASYKFRNSNAKKVIVSSDKDYYQLLDDPKVVVYDPATRSVITKEEVKQKYGIEARNFCVARAFVGDTSDNIPGVEGVGLKTLVKRFPCLAEDRDIFIEEILSLAKKEIDSGSKIKAHGVILESKEEVKRNWELMYLRDLNISASQSQKLDYQIDNKERVADKFSFIKELISLKIPVNFDVDRLFRNFNNVNL